jgi:hypothetical protein
MQLDRTDQRLLAELQHDGNVNSELATAGRAVRVGLPAAR